jgi:hypothetical protein
MGLGSDRQYGGKGETNAPEIKSQDGSRVHQMISRVASARPRAKTTGDAISLCRTNRKKNSPSFL